jgi:hypothetical protein
LRRVPISLSRASVKTDLLRVVDYGQVRVVSRGPADKMWEQNGNNKPQTPPKTVLRDIGKG